MRFYLVDRILKLEPDRRIVAVKNLTLAEEYLADHFPAYPVLPGVMMLEALVQAAAWLVRASTDFAKTLVLLKETQNVRYGNFLRPGGQMVMEVEAVEIGADSSRFKAQARWDGQMCVQARFTLEHLNVADEDPGGAELDGPLREHLRQRFRIVGGLQALEAARAGPA
jgi:3-hydroxyacyl-[acyl-carrier-protein] dehydratase